MHGRLQNTRSELTLQSATPLYGVRLESDASATLRVRFDTETGEAPPAVPVFACSPQRQPLLAQRDGQGFVLPGLPLGEYSVRSGAPECEQRGATPVVLSSDGEVVEVEIELTPPAKVHGWLLDRDGLGVVDAWVQVTHAHPLWALVAEEAPVDLTAADGEFELSGLMPGHYQLLARATVGRGTALRDIFVEAGKRLELVLGLEEHDSSDPPDPPKGRPTSRDPKPGENQ